VNRAGRAAFAEYDSILFDAAFLRLGQEFVEPLIVEPREKSYAAQLSEIRRHDKRLPCTCDCSARAADLAGA
jgi:hypothetical protein